MIIMKLKKTLCILLCALFFQGCVSSKSIETETVFHHPLDKYTIRVINSANIKEENIDKFSKKLIKQLTKADLYDEKSNYVIEVRFYKNYRKNNYLYTLDILSLGICSIFFCADNIASDVRLKDARNNQHEGQYKITSRNFWLVRPYFVIFNDHAIEIVSTLKAARKERL